MNLAKISWGVLTVFNTCLGYELTDNFCNFGCEIAASVEEEIFLTTASN